jgi:outer membrane receptor protein involved in Fe transport
MTTLLTIALLMPPAVPAPGAVDSVVIRPDTIVVQPVTVLVSLKHGGDYSRQPVMATSLDVGGPGSPSGGPVVESKNLSLTVPNMLHADYGSRMTGSIYVRGLGSRMEHPAMGLYVDNVPVLNKNNYDFDYFDLRRIDVLRGPQGTLYGRNTIGGVIDVHTLSPFDWQGVRLTAGYGNGNSWEGKAAIYRREGAKFGWSVAASHRRSDGFFTNTFDGSDADRSRSNALRFKIQARINGGWTVENSLSAGLVRQNGFAYAPYDEATGAVGEINHNDPCTYNRFSVVDGLTFRYTGGEVALSSTSSWQFTDDEMVLDQDFSPVSMFTLKQSQREHAVTQEFVARSTGTRRWQWLAGLFGFYRRLGLEAPVTFRRDGIDNLILGNANNGIDMLYPPDRYPDTDLFIREESFPVHSRFELPAGGLSLYHQSTWDAGRWSFTAGVRADWEHTAIHYRNSAEINYMFTPSMTTYKPLPVEMNGRRKRDFFEVMPRAAVMYAVPAGRLYVSAARGYKAGGYNTQIFSDIVQNRMMNDLIERLIPGLHGQTYDVENAITYEPERSWNYELGSHLSWFDGRLEVDAALFWIDCRNQQLTVFPPGNGTGRLMSNAGRTRSLGGELSVRYRVGDLRLAGSYGHTDARFVDYNDGRDDYAGNHVPYAPSNTLSVQAEYGIDLRGGDAGRLTLSLGVQGAGRMMWNEANTLSQPFYWLPNASAGWQRERLGVSVWVRNFTGTTHNTFYFKSVGHSFVQRGKPLQTGVTIFLNL